MPILKFFSDLHPVDQLTYWDHKKLKTVKCHLRRVLTVDSKLSGRSFMYIRKSNGPNIKPCGTPARTDNQFEHWPLSTTL